MQKELEESVISGMAQEERISVKNGNPIIKLLTLNVEGGKKIAAIVTIYNRPGQGKFRPQSYGVVVIPIEPDGLLRFSTGCAELANKLNVINSEIDGLVKSEDDNLGSSSDTEIKQELKSGIEYIAQDTKEDTEEESKDEEDNIK